MFRSLLNSAKLFELKKAKPVFVPRRMMSCGRGVLDYTSSVCTSALNNFKSFGLAVCKLKSICTSPPARFHVAHAPKAVHQCRGHLKLCIHGFFYQWGLLIMLKLEKSILSFYIKLFISQQ